ncbi:hypothetical protein [uncultured Thomasclavelia sp.]|uniref:hypothetical protein n=1 Tax=uncultured Thomasclavelia sp. TaxID=3025759 RepID=UPI0025FC77B9|nr:hypothetical protein [uncultured Thomasclavelia sp.]
MNLNQINDKAVNSLHQYFEDDYTRDINEIDAKQMNQEEITNLVKNQADQHREKIASLEVLRKNINVKAKSSMARYY